MRKNKEFVLYILIILLISSDLWGQNTQPVIRPTVKTAFPVYTLTWNKDGSLFSYAEQGNIVIRKTSDYSVSKLIETSSDEIFAIRYASSITDRSVVDRIVSVSTDNRLEGRALPDKPLITFNESSYYRRPTSLAISASGDYVATGMADGSIELFMWYFTTNTFTRRTPLQTIGRYIHSVDFSRKNNYLAAATDANSTFIFDVSSGIAIHTLPYNSDLKIGIHFTSDSKGIISAVDETTLGIYNFDSELITTMKIKDQIRDFQVTKDGKQIYVLTKKNQLRLYNTSTGKELGYITPFNNTEISSYAISPDGTKLLIGHQDGSIYLCLIRENLLKPGEKSPQYSKSKGSGNENGTTDVIHGTKVPLLVSVYNLTDASKKTDDLGNKLKPMYAYAIDVGSGYYDYDLLSPFYFGGAGALKLGFPSYYFPSTYNKEDGTSISPPLLMGLGASGLFGYSIVPPNADFALFTEMNLGLSIHSMWTRRFGSDFYMSKPSVAVVVTGKLGAAYKDFNFSIFGSVNTFTGFSGGVELKYNIKITKNYIGGT